jgi:hypothetical protein
MDGMTTVQQNSRYGFYYYPDTLHYRETDIHRWIPEFRLLGASWVTLLSPLDRAIPEAFIRSLLDAGVEPIIHLPLPTSGAWDSKDLSLILEAYSRWGTRYVSLFDRPNLRKNWTPSQWSQENLVERFLDLYIPTAHLVLQSAMTPALPALEPGGDYWDTAFLYSLLFGLNRRNENDLVNQLVLSAYAWSGNRSPNWGAGGPERWPNARPYSTPHNSEDQVGFRIFDWYLAISQAILGKRPPIILLAGGSLLGDQPDNQSPAVDLQAHTWQNMTLVRLLSGQAEEYDPVPEEVLTCNFWLLSADQDEYEVKNAWYQPDNSELPVVREIKEWVVNGNSNPVMATNSKYYSKIPGFQPISHYLLLPNLDLGMTEHNLKAIQPFLNKYHPTIGFSPVEASHAKKVTIMNGTAIVPESIIDGLLAAGCIVEQINEDGMNIARSISALPIE